MPHSRHTSRLTFALDEATDGNNAARQGSPIALRLSWSRNRPVASRSSQGFLSDRLRWRVQVTVRAGATPGFSPRRLPRRALPAGRDPDGRTGPSTSQKPANECPSALWPDGSGWDGDRSFRPEPNTPRARRRRGPASPPGRGDLDYRARSQLARESLAKGKHRRRCLFPRRRARSHGPALGERGEVAGFLGKPVCPSRFGVLTGC